MDWLKSIPKLPESFSWAVGFATTFWKPNMNIDRIIGFKIISEMGHVYKQIELSGACCLHKQKQWWIGRNSWEKLKSHPAQLTTVCKSWRRIGFLEEVYNFFPVIVVFRCQWRIPRTELWDQSERGTFSEVALRKEMNSNQGVFFFLPKIVFFNGIWVFL